jgi:hypothetical protein
MPQLANNHLPLHLEADDEEENRHQSVVDPVLQRVHHREVPEGETHLRLPQSGVPVARRAVGQDQGDDRADHQQNAAGGLDVEEALYWIGAPVDGFAGRQVPWSVLGHEGISLWGSGHRSIFQHLTVKGGCPSPDIFFV